MTNDSCEFCSGTGRFYPGNTTGWPYCPECHGLGWNGRIVVPLQLHDTTSEKVSYPPFDEAVRMFARFLREQSVVAHVSFVPRSAITVWGRKAYVQRGSVGQNLQTVRIEYEAAVRRRLGVGLHAACRLPNGDIAAFVYGPTDIEEAISLMYPDGVKYSVPSELRDGAIVERMGTILLSILRRRVKRVREQQEWLK